MQADVAIVGMGPVGAVLAGLLGKRGINVVVVERETGVYPHPRAAHVDHTGLRTIQELGCLDQILPNMVRNRALDLVDAEHRVLVRVPADQESVSRLPTSMYFYQPEFDAVLRRTAEAMPTVDVRLATEMIAFEERARSVAVTIRGPGGKEEVVDAGWLVGCDGAWSPVRERLGVKLESLNFDEQWLVLDLKLLEPQPDLPVDRVVQVCDPARPHLTTPIAEGRQRFEFMMLGDETPEQMKKPEVVEKLLAPWLPRGSYAVERLTTYVFHGLVARQWRRGRVLIAGDAAHQMPPFLGQGMCSGIRDAANLAWKLAMVAQGLAHERILDTYQAERSPHVREIVQAAVTFGRLVCELDPQAAADRDRRLRTEGRVGNRTTFTLPRLLKGPLVLEGGGSLFLQPEIDGTRLDDWAGSEFLVIARARRDLGGSAAWWEGRQAKFLCLEEFDHDELRAWLDREQANVLVVRPDRYVLGAAENLDTITRAVRSFVEAPQPVGLEAS